MTFSQKINLFYFTLFIFILYLLLNKLFFIIWKFIYIKFSILNGKWSDRANYLKTYLRVDTIIILIYI